MEFVDLLENYLILKERDRELYYDIKDNVDKYKEFIKDNLSYDLIIKDDFIKLEKLPGVPEPWMGIRSFSDIKEYIFFIILIMFLEDKNKEEQFILSNITEYIEHNYPDEKIEWTIFRNRKSLISVIKVALDIGIIKKNDGDEDNFSKSASGEVLYESTGISRYIVRRFTKEIYDSYTYEDLIDDSWSGISNDKGLVRKNRVFRRLLLSPIVYNEGAEDSDYEYIKSYRSSVISAFEKYINWDLHVHRNGALVVLQNQNMIKDTFPNQKGESKAVLFINRRLCEMIKNNKLQVSDNDTIRMNYGEFIEIILSVRQCDGHGFTKAIREYSDKFFVETIVAYMSEFSMIRVEDDTVTIMPLVGKIIGEYPKDYEGGI